MAIFVLAVILFLYVVIAHAMVAWAARRGSVAKRNVMALVETAVAQPREVSVRRYDLELRDMLAADNNQVGIFECAGCDMHFVRNQPGYVRIGDYFEFCSEQCRQDPVPFPSIASATTDESLN